MKRRSGLGVLFLLMFALVSCNLPTGSTVAQTQELVPTQLLTEPPVLTEVTSADGDEVAILSINPPMPAGLSAADPISVFLRYKLGIDQGTLQIWFERFSDAACTMTEQSPDGGTTIGGILQYINGGTSEITVEIPPVALLDADYVGVGIRLWKGDSTEILAEDSSYAICYQAKAVPIVEMSSEAPDLSLQLTPVADVIAGSGSIAGLVFTDANVNGTKDSGETGAGSIEVRLANSSCSSAITTATSDGSGAFSFRDVPAGSYCAIIRSTGAYRRVTVVAGNNSQVQLPFVPSLPPPTPPPASSPGYCGDGVMQASLGEQCDPPNLTNCTASCQSYTGYCGNGIVDPSLGEQCDPPNITDCTASCQTYVGYCGNGIVDPGLGEQCDPPNITDCTASCQSYTAYCGNGIVDPGEQCDPPNITDCTASCQSYVGYCGNWIVDAGEECDPPNITDCTASCQSWP